MIRHTIMAGAAGAALMATVAIAQDASEPLGASAQGDVAVSIYQNGQALVQDVRRLDIERGRSQIQFPDVSARIRPETLSFAAPDTAIVEQNFDFDLLTPTKMMEKSIGRTVTLLRTNPATGAETRERATVLSTAGGVVLRIGDRIEVLRDDGLPVRVIFDEVPPNLRARPTLSVNVESTRGGTRPVSIRYLTAGLGWSADYVALYDEASDAIDMQGWVTLTNQTGTTFNRAQTLLVAGNPNAGTYAGPNNGSRRISRGQVRSANGNLLRPGTETADRESVGEFYLYPLAERTTIANAQTKQVSFLDVQGVAARKTYTRTVGWLSNDGQPVNCGQRNRFQFQPRWGAGRCASRRHGALLSEGCAGYAAIYRRERHRPHPDGQRAISENRRCVRRLHASCSGETRAPVRAGMGAHRALHRVRGWRGSAPDRGGTAGHLLADHDALHADQCEKHARFHRPDAGRARSWLVEPRLSYRGRRPAGRTGQCRPAQLGSAGARQRHARVPGHIRHAVLSGAVTRRLTFLTGISLAALCVPATAQTEPRAAIDASAPQSVAVTIYRDPDRAPDAEMRRTLPRGFAMISETRTVTLPPGRSTLRFEGVAEGMIAVSAIVTGLPGGTIEKNRNADLLSPAALLDGTLGNRVRITRSNPATGEAESERAVVRTRADGGIVLQTEAGYEAVRCSGLPEGLSYDRVPEGLSAKPVFSIDTRDDAGGTYTVTLTYLAWGFDWRAHYVAYLGERAQDGTVRYDLESWLTLLNDNAQSFPDAELLVVAGALNVETDFEKLSDPPQAAPLRITCFPIGSTAAGSRIERYDNLAGAPPPPPSVPMMMADAMQESIVVTGSRVSRAKVAMQAGEEDLGDLKLYRVPEPVTVAAQSLKQVAFLQKENVRGRFAHLVECDAYTYTPDWSRAVLDPTQMILETVNETRSGLGVALPSGGISVFERVSDMERFGPLLFADDGLRDYAVSQDVEIAVGDASRVRALCTSREEKAQEALRAGTRAAMRVQVVNSSMRDAPMRVRLGPAGAWRYRTRGMKQRIKDGMEVIEFTVRAGQTRTVDWSIRSVADADE